MIILMLLILIRIIWDAFPRRGYSITFYNPWYAWIIEDQLIMIIILLLLLLIKEMNDHGRKRANCSYLHALYSHYGVLLFDGSSYFGKIHINYISQSILSEIRYSNESLISIHFDPFVVFGKPQHTGKSLLEEHIVVQRSIVSSKGELGCA